MSTRKHSYPPTPTPTPEKDLEPDPESKSTKRLRVSPFNSHLKYPLSILSFLSFWFLLFFCFFPPTTRTQLLSPRPNTTLSETGGEKKAPPCELGAWVYVYELPPEFNSGLLSDCHHLNVYTDMCPHVANSGLGQPLSRRRGWYSTHQFIAEMIFHARVVNHPCRTRDPASAGIFYVPFYGGLHASSKFREPDLEARDALAVALADYVARQPSWRRRHGRDHFIALGRTAWDFMRNPAGGGPDFGANRLLKLPPVRNMSVLTVERNPWQGTNQHGIPYPSYFHPSTADEMSTWQDLVMRAARPHLFSFIGGPRKGVGKAAIRDEIIAQCRESARCELAQCGGGGGANGSKCFEPVAVVEAMMGSEFCLQAPGDSFTRRSTFDSVLAGCIPVFFSKHTAYTQYQWFLPREPSEYSVYIEGGEEEDGAGRRRRRRIEEELLKIPAETVARMRRTVVDLIPRLTYAHPNTTRPGFRDAVDVALAALTRHVASISP